MSTSFTQPRPDTVRPAASSVRHFLGLGLALLLAITLATGTLAGLTIAPAHAAVTTMQLTARTFELGASNALDSVKLNWSAVSGATSYRVSRGQGGSLTTVATVPGTSFDDYNLDSGKSYAYRVEALDSSGAVIGESSAVSSSTVAAPEGLKTFDNLHPSSLDLKSTLMDSTGTYYRYDFQSDSNGFSGLVEKTSADGHTFSGNKIVLTAAQVCGSASPALTTCKLESASIVKNPTTGHFVLIAHFENKADYTLAQLLIAEAVPGQAFSVISNERPLGHESRDASVFTDGADAYVISATNNNADINLYRLDANWTHVAALTNTLLAGQHREAPAMVKTDGHYYLFTSQANGWYPSQPKYSVATSLDGTWSDLKEVGNASTFGAQSGGIVRVGDDYAMMANRWSAQWKYPETSNYSRLLPLSFDDDFVSFDLFDQIKYNDTTLVPVQTARILSVGKPVRATDAAASNAATAANDGIQSQADNYYMPTSENLPFTWEVDLQQAAQVSRVDLTTKIVGGSDTYYQYKVEGSLDRKSYHTLYDGSANKLVAFQSDAIVDATPVRYVRVTVTGIINIQNGNSAAWARGINEITVYGDPTDTAAPETVEPVTADVAAGTYYEAKTVTLVTATPNASIYYTTDGTTPTAKTGTAYQGPIKLNATTTLKAVALKDGLNDSAILTNKYVIKDGATAVALVNPVYAAAYTGQQPNLPTQVQVTTASGEVRTAPVTWDLDGYSFDNPYRSLTVYGTADGTLDVTAQVEVVPTSVKYFIDSGMAGSTSPSYEGVKSLVGSDLLNQVSDQAYTDGRWGYLATGRDGTVAPGDANDKDSNGHYGKNAPSGDWLRYTLSNVAAGTYTLTTGHREWWSGPRTMDVSVTDASGTTKVLATGVTVGSNAALYSRTKMTSTSFTQPADGPITVNVYRSAGSEGPVIGWLALAQGEVAVDTTPLVVDAPTADLAPGIYKDTQKVSLATATAGASIYYTTDGTDASRTNGTLYTGPITIETTETVKAIAFKNGTLSTQTQAAYEIEPVPAKGYSSVPVGRIWYDQEGDHIQAHGGGFLERDGWYYWVGENKSTNSALFHGVSLYKSRDLLNWTYVSDILTPETAGVCTTGNYDDTTCNIERPKLLFNEKTGRYVLWAHWETKDSYSASHLIVATSSTIDGDYSIAQNFRPGAGHVSTDDADPTYTGTDGLSGYGSRDFTVWKDPDTTDAYLVSTQNGSSMRMYKLSDDYTDVDWQNSYPLFDNMRREAPAMVKVGDYYFVITSSQSGWYPNQAMYSYTKDPSDPDGWSDLKPLGNNTTFYSQPTNIMTVQATDGSRGYIYMGDRWRPNQLGSSTYVWLPLDFKNTDGNSPAAAMSFDPAWKLDTTTHKIVHSTDTLVSQDKPILDATSASSSDYPATAANDGNIFNLNTAGDSSSYYGPSSVPFTWTVDLEQPYDLTRIDLAFRSYNGSETYSQYTVEGSNDGDTWTRLVGQGANTTVGFKSDALTGTYRYIRVNVTKVVNDHNGNDATWAAGLVEVQVYADTTPDEPGDPGDPGTPDTTAPAITWRGALGNGGRYVFGTVPAAPTCAAVDTVSGNRRCTVTGYARTVGTHTLTATSTDAAGNTARRRVTYTVTPWTVKGFKGAHKGLNKVKAGKKVSLRFEVFAGRAERTTLSSITRVDAQQISCRTGAPLSRAKHIAGVRYDRRHGVFLLKWKAPKKVGRCVRVTVTAADGSTIKAMFRVVRPAARRHRR